MRGYKKLLIWQKGMELVESTYKIARSLPAEERYGLKSQSTRAAVSIVLNIAEGSAKASRREYRKYLEISLASAIRVRNRSFCNGKTETFRAKCNGEGDG